MNLIRRLAYLYIGSAIIGLIASVVLTAEKIHLLQDPNHIPSCSINPIFSCLGIMKSEQASLFGIPNSIFGIAAFSMLLLLGWFLLDMYRPSRRMWHTIVATSAAGFIFMHYLFIQAVFVLHTICPWCFVVWIVTIPVFWYTAVFVLQHNYITVPSLIRHTIIQFRHDIIIGWYVLILMIIIVTFWGAWIVLL